MQRSTCVFRSFENSNLLNPKRKRGPRSQEVIYMYPNSLSSLLSSTRQSRRGATFSPREGWQGAYTGIALEFKLGFAFLSPGVHDLRLILQVQVKETPLRDQAPKPQLVKRYRSSEVRIEALFALLAGHVQQIHMKVYFSY